MKRFLILMLGLCFGTMVLAQSRSTVTGTVTAKDDGLPIPGANIIVKGTKTGTFTDGNGKFSLANVQSNAILVISSIGYTTQEVGLGGRTKIEVALASDAVGLDETIIVAYGTAKKGTYTGAASVVRADAISSVPTTKCGALLRKQHTGYCTRDEQQLFKGGFLYNLKLQYNFQPET